MVGYWLTAIFGLCGPSVQADTVFLNNGGQMKGTIVQLRFRKGGETVTFGLDKMGEISRISISARGDEITVSGKKWEGRILDVKIKTIGGALAFKRAEFRGLEKKLSERERLLAEYKKKAAALEETDADGWYKLASWSGRSNLRRQEREAARRSLEIDPDHTKNASAHRILGHVQKNGQWLTASEVKELEKQASAQKAQEMRAKGFVKVGSRWVSQDEMERIKSLKERIEEVTDSIYEEAEEWAEGRLSEVQQEVARVQERSSTASQNYESARVLRASHAGDGCSTEIRAAADMKRYKSELKKLPASSEVRETKWALRSTPSNQKSAVGNAISKTKASA